MVKAALKSNSSGRLFFYLQFPSAKSNYPLCKTQYKLHPLFYPAFTLTSNFNFIFMQNMVYEKNSTKEVIISSERKN